MQSIHRSVNWKSLPGNFDVLHLDNLYPATDNAYGIPTLAPATVVPSSLIQWGSKNQLADTTLPDKTAVHFFLDDFRFESLWKNPERNLDLIQQRGIALTPDFSLWLDMPLAMQIWNVYRNRYIGAFWQENDIHVIPTISWSDSASYDFCFCGVTPGSMVAISTVGVRDKEARTLFQAGFDKMIEVIQPAAVICYGSLHRLGIQTGTNVIEYPSRWDQFRARGGDN